MKRRKNGRDMATVLDKARELARNEPAVDWPEAEWKGLMAAAVAQEIDRGAGRDRSGRKPEVRTALWRPALSYGTLTLAAVAIIGLALWETLFKPMAGPESPSVIVQNSAPPSLPPAEAAPDKMPSVIAPVPGGFRATRAPGVAAAKTARTVIHPGKPALPAALPQRPTVPRAESSQDVVAVKLVSPDTGLRIVWFLNKDFEWKGEHE